MSRWWKRWGFIDVVALGGGTALAGMYVVHHYSETDRSTDALLDLWPNIATEIIGVWLSVRIIGAILSSREERRDVRDRLAGNLNFLLGICRRLAPHFDAWRLQDLRDEIQFYREKRELRPKAWRKHLSPEERQFVDSAFDDAEKILDRASVAARTAEEAKRLRSSADRWGLETPEASLDKLFDQYRGSSDPDPKSLIAALGSCRQILNERGRQLERLADAYSFCDAVEAHLNARRDCEIGVNALEADIQRFRKAVWAELAA